MFNSILKSAQVSGSEQEREGQSGGARALSSGDAAAAAL